MKGDINNAPVTHQQLLHLQVQRWVYAWLLPEKKVLAKAIQLKPNSFLTTAEVPGQAGSVTHAGSPID